ncbi:class I SAM-dependent methyltransferase [Roseibium sp.]|uniref:class I SAM-dependent methyltransferase n=1 Tax=Roseibium sp. TaxID=1936156 RepID=UPI003A9758E5
MMDMSGAHSEAMRAKVRKVRELKAKALDEVRFFRSWVENPLKTGAVSPSGPHLAQKMASFVTPAPHSQFVELGPGTGVVTKALFDRGVGHKDLLSVEYSEDFCRLLKARYPGLNVVQGDAYALKELLGSPEIHGFGSNGLDGIISSLPLFTRPEEERKRLLNDALELLKPGAPFVQFSYALVPPVKPEPGRFSVTKTDWIWKNLPPARVWVYRRVH